MAYCSLDADYQISKNSNCSDRQSTENKWYDTDNTDSGDEDVQMQDASDADLLFKDNEYPLEYYIQQLANIDEILNI